MRPTRLPMRSTDKPLPSRPVASLTSDGNQIGRTLLDARDQPLPGHPQFVPLTPGSVNMSLNSDSRPLSPSASSFSRIRRTSGLPIRSRTSSPVCRTPDPLRRTSSLLSTSTPGSYSVTDDEMSGLRSVNRTSREARTKRCETAQFHKPKVISIPASKKKANQTQYSSSPPSASIHTAPLATIRSQALLPTVDFDALHDLSHQPAATPPSTPLLELPPRSDSRVPLTELVQHAASNDGDDDASHYGDGHEFDHFSGVVATHDSDDDAGQVDDDFDPPLARGYIMNIRNISPAGSTTSVTRNDSRMGSFRKYATNDVALATNDVVEAESSQLPEPKLESPFQTAPPGLQREQEFADRIEPLLPPVQLPRPIASSSTGPSGYGGLAGVQTAGKMRAARDAAQIRGPSFARTTASSAAKSSAPPDIPKMAHREPKDALKYPPKRRGMLNRIGGLFHKGPKKNKTQVKASPIAEEKSPVRLRVGRNPSNNKLGTKRQSLVTALEVPRVPTPLLPPSPSLSRIRTPEWRPSPLESASQVTLTKSRIPPPTFFGRRSVSPMTDTPVTPTPVGGPLQEGVSGESTGPNATLIVADGTTEATQRLVDRLNAQATNERDADRKNKLFTLALTLRESLYNARRAALCAAKAMLEANQAASYTDMNERFLILLQRRAVGAVRQARE